MVKLYQNLKVDGAKFNCHKDRVGSEFWNEGKFHNFIEPHLPDNCKEMVFVEMGCNAGLFLKMAKDKGFEHVVGIEKNKTPVKEGRRYRDLIGYNYRIMKRTLGGKYGNEGNFNIEELPVADYTIMSTFHYYVPIDIWLRYVDRLKHKTRYVVIVSRDSVMRRHWRAGSRRHQLKKYFHDWKEVKYIPEMPKEVKAADHKSRDIWSISFKSPLERIKIDSIKRTKQDEPMYTGMYELAKMARNGNSYVQDSDYYKMWVNRKEGRWDAATLDKFVCDKYKTMIEIRDSGLKEPLVVRKGNKLCDGGHRASMMKALGYETVIVRRV